MSQQSSSKNPPEDTSKGSEGLSLADRLTSLVVIQVRRLMRWKSLLRGMTGFLSIITMGATIQMYFWTRYDFSCLAILVPLLCSTTFLWWSADWQEKTKERSSTTSPPESK